MYVSVSVNKIHSLFENIIIDLCITGLAKKFFQ